MPRLVLACAGLLACSAPSEPAPSPSSSSLAPLAELPTTRPSEPATPLDIPVAPTSRQESHTIDGRTFELTIVVPTLQMVGEPVEVLFEISGDGLEVEVAYMGRNALGRPDNYRLTVLDAAGDPLPERAAGPQFGGQSWTVQLSPERRHRQDFLLPHWIDGALVPGRYTVRVETDLRVRVPGGPWRETRVGLSAPFELVADDPDRLARGIRQLGDDAVGDDFERAERAMRRLAVMQGPDVIRQWLRIAELPTYTAKQSAARALAPSTDDRAHAAVVRLAATRAADLAAAAYANESLREQSAAQLRLTCAQGLAASPHPRALDALLAMKADPDASVRLTVLHRVALLPGGEAIPLLDQFAADPDRHVAHEARRYRGERR